MEIDEIKRSSTILLAKYFFGLEVKSLILQFIVFFDVAYTQENILPPYRGFEGCGDYKISGVIIEYKHKLFLYINKDTQSEYRFTIPAKEEITIAPYINRALEATIFIKKMNGTIGELEKIRDTKFHIPDPLNPTSDTGLRLIKKGMCAS